MQIQYSSSQPGFDTTQQKLSLQQFSRTISPSCSTLTQFILKYSQSELNVYEQQFSRFLCEIFKHLYESRSGVNGDVCNMMGDQVFRCQDCMFDEDAAMCIQCFNNSNHKGHSYKKINIGGYCGCGDQYAMKKQGFCPTHRTPKKDYVRRKVDLKYAHTFHQEIGYLFYLLPQIVLTSDHKIRNKFSLFFGKSILIVLLLANHENAIANELTSTLLKSTLQYLIPQNFNFLYRKWPVLKISLVFYWQFMECMRFGTIFSVVFSQSSFKKYFVINFFKALSKFPNIWTTKHIEVGFRLCASSKLINQLIDLGQIQPFRVSAQNIPYYWDFRIVGATYQKFMDSMERISSLSDEAGQKYIKLALMEGNIVDFSGYEEFMRYDIEESVKMYQVQSFYSWFLPEILKKIKEEKTILLKCIRDIINHLKNKDQNQPLSLFIPKQRTLLFLLFTYFDGKILKASNSQFMNFVGLNFDIIFNMMASVLHVFKFYAYNLSNVQTQARFPEFYLLTLDNMPKIMVSIDMEIIRFCLSAFMNFKIDTEKIIQFQALISEPIKKAQLLVQNAVNHEEAVYDRKKSIQMLVDYLGLFHEIFIMNHSKINCQNCLNLGSESQYRSFYGSLIKSLRYVKIQDFEKLCVVFLNLSNKPYLKQFLNDECEVQNNRFSLKKQKKHLYNGFNLSYLRSKKRCSYLQPYWEENMKQFHLNQIPKIEEIKGYQPLQKFIFNQNFLQSLIKAVESYQNSLMLHPKLRISDIGFFSQLIQELIRINYTLKNHQIGKIIMNLRENSQLFSLLSNYTRKQVLVYLGQDEKDNSQKQMRDKNRSAKEKKLQKFKNKQNKIYEKLNQQNEKLASQEQGSHFNNTMSDFLCIYCHQSDFEEPLQSLNYITKSALFSNLYLECTIVALKIVGCGHFIHRGCFYQVQREESKKVFSCSCCSFYTNLQLFTQSQSQSHKDKMGQNYEIIKAASKVMPKIAWNLQLVQEKNIWQVISLEQKLVLSLVTSILEGIFINSDTMVRKYLSAFSCVFSGLKDKLIDIDNLVEEVWHETKGQSKNENIDICRFAFKFTLIYLCSFLIYPAKKQDFKNKARELQKHLPTQLKNQIVQVIKSLDNKNNKNLIPQLQIPTNFSIAPKFIEFSPNLQDLFRLVYQCPNCGKKENQIAICVICGFCSCIQCKKVRLTFHSTQEHGWSTVFIQLDTGNPIYISGFTNYRFNSIYKNYLGQFYDKHDRNKKTYRRSEFNLDRTAYENIKKDLMRHKIEEQIQNYRNNIKKGKIMEVLP